MTRGKYSQVDYLLLFLAHTQMGGATWGMQRIVAPSWR
jgi:hypothetical protein